MKFRNDSRRIAIQALETQKNLAAENLEIIKKGKQDSLTAVLESNDNNEDVKEIIKYYKDIEFNYFKRIDSSSKKDKDAFFKSAELFFAIYDSKTIMEILGVKILSNIILWEGQIAIQDGNMDALKSSINFLSTNMDFLEIEEDIVERKLNSKIFYYLQKGDYQKLLDGLNNGLTQKKINSLSFETQIDIIEAKLISLYYLKKYSEALDLINQVMTTDIFNYIVDSGKIQRLTDRERYIKNQIGQANNF